MSKLVVLLAVAAAIGAVASTGYGSGTYHRGTIGGGNYGGSGSHGGSYTWSSWGYWGTCSKACGGGYQTRTRTCNKPSYGYGNCDGSSSETQPCNSGYCKVNGGWSSWGYYGDCSKTCGTGYKTKYRTCTNPAPSYGGSDCYGSSSYTESCTGSSHYCSVNGGWSAWGYYGDCSKTCGTGYKTKYRTCTNPAPAYGGSDCYGSSSYTESCTGSSHYCAVNGGWSAWGYYGDCSKSCGTGYKTRYRTCTNPAPSYGGSDCYGSSSYTESCTGTGYCPVHGGWSAWGYYGDCSKSCGTGYKTRYRTCTNPAPSYGGNKCYGSASHTLSCTGSGYHCKVHGGWSSWGYYGDCSKSCGPGYKTRYRTCTSPAPSYGGNNCYGSNHEKLSCNKGACGGYGHY